ncbi:MAG: class I SAM-dependent methyltransferase, partial [Thermoplasmatota archaeon]
PDTETTHVENGVSYRLDPQRVMFSSGNVDERIRMASVASPGEVVVDLFAGIGYFTLPLAVHGNARVYACELNSTAAQYLRDSAALNNVESHIEIREGDCRDVAPHGVAERVVMGYLKAAPFLPTAMASLHPAGGILHYHCTCSAEDFPDEPLGDVRQAAEYAERSAELLQQRIVKSYAPGIVHGVLDVAVE